MGVEVTLVQAAIQVPVEKAPALVLQAKVLLLVVPTKVLVLQTKVIVLAGSHFGAVARVGQIVILNVTTKKTRTASNRFGRKGDLLYNIHIASKKEFEMGFEAVVLDRVANVLNDEHKASFAYGTLFVNCTAEEAAKIETSLNKIGHVIVSKTPAEYAFDFVA